MNIVNDLLSDLTGMLSEFRHGTHTRTITVAKAVCAPARPVVFAALQSYGVKIYDYREYQKFTSPRAWLRQQRIDDAELNSFRDVPLATFADVTVSEQAAAWAEYLLLRTGRLYVPGQYVNRRNQQWASRHGGRMPPQWDRGEPLIEASCQAGRDAWRDVQAAMRKGRGKK